MLEQKSRSHAGEPKEKAFRQKALKNWPSRKKLKIDFNFK